MKILYLTIRFFLKILNNNFGGLDSLLFEYEDGYFDIGLKRGVGLFTYFQMEFHNAEHTVLYITMILMNLYGDRTELRYFLGEPHVFVLAA